MARKRDHAHADERWLLNWVAIRNTLAQQLAATQEVLENMEHNSEGGSPYA
jgi:hypothetical protein